VNDHKRMIQDVLAGLRRENTEGLGICPSAVAAAQACPPNTVYNVLTNQCVAVAQGGVVGALGVKGGGGAADLSACGVQACTLPTLVAGKRAGNPWCECRAQDGSPTSCSMACCECAGRPGWRKNPPGAIPPDRNVSRALCSPGEAPAYDGGCFRCLPRPAAPPPSPTSSCSWVKVDTISGYAATWACRDNMTGGKASSPDCCPARCPAGSRHGDLCLAALPAGGGTWADTAAAPVQAQAFLGGDGRWYAPDGLGGSLVWNGCGWCRP
jgi:hypothetical protein